jgi:hypothetical protein
MTSQNTKGRKKINRRPKQQGRAAAKPLPPSLYAGSRSLFPNIKQWVEKIMPKATPHKKGETKCQMW